MPAKVPLFTAESVAAALVWVAATLLILGMMTLVVRRRRGDARARLDHLPAVMASAALVAHTVVRYHILGRLPVGNLGESAWFLAMLLSLAYVVAAVRYDYPAVDLLLLALASGFVLLGSVVPQENVSASLGSRWFAFHTLSSFLGVLLLLAAGIESALYLLAENQLKSKRPSSLLRLLPSLVACDGAALKLLVFGHPLLSLGIISGWMWGLEAAREAWGPKELAAVLAWLLYSALLFARLFLGFRGRRAAILSVSAAAIAILAFLGIRL